MKMRKLVAVLMAVMMLCCIVPFSAMAAGNSAKIDFTDRANRAFFDPAQQVWQQNEITVTNDQGASTSPVADYADPARFYKNSTVVIEYPGMTAIVIDCTGLDAKYVDSWSNSFSADATATVDNGIVTIELAEAADSFTWDAMTAQARAYSITVYTDGATPEAPVEPEEPETPDVPAWEVVTEPDVDIAYKLGLNQTQKGAVYYFTGAMSGYYGATETDVSLAVDMYLENAEGGYLLYFTDANGAKQYINLVQSGTYYNFTFGAAGSVFSWDAERNALYATCGDEICYMGTYGSYVTVGTLRTSKLADTDYIARLYAEPEAAEDVLTVSEAIAMGTPMEHNTYTEMKYYITGEIASVDNTIYGNMYIQDKDGNKILVYGTWSADGSIRYDALEVKPVAGDTITIYGPVGNYNGNPQIKNAWIVDHVPGEGGEEPEVPAGPNVEVATELKEGVAYKLGLEQAALGNNYYFTGTMSGYYGATDTDFTKGVDMYIEGAEDGYKLYFNDESGAKKYIALVVSGTYYNFTIADEGTSFFMDPDKNAFCAFVGEEVCYMGTYGSYFTMSVLKSSKLSETDYIARLYVEAQEAPVDPEEPGDTEEPGEDEEPGNTETPDEDVENEGETDSPETGDNSTVFATLAVIMMALAAVVAALTAKKRA